MDQFDSNDAIPQKQNQNQEEKMMRRRFKVLIEHLYEQSLVMDVREFPNLLRGAQKEWSIHMQASQKFQCDLCGKEFNQRGSLSKHKKKVDCLKQKQKEKTEAQLNIKNEVIGMRQNKNYRYDQDFDLDDSYLDDISQMRETLKNYEPITIDDD